MAEANSSTHKKIVVRKLDGDEVKGFANKASFLGPEGVEMLDLNGRFVTLPLADVKGVYFVRDFEATPPRRERKTFLTRPKIGGLWVRLTFIDNDIIEGVIPNNLNTQQEHGLMVTPPDFSANNQKIYVPKAALRELEVLSVVTDGGARRARRKTTYNTRQLRLFTGKEGD